MVNKKTCEIKERKKDKEMKWLEIQEEKPKKDFNKEPNNDKRKYQDKDRDKIHKGIDIILRQRPRLQCDIC